jgi:tetratricopeptide (TPR) repeat protein
VQQQIPFGHEKILGLRSNGVGVDWGLEFQNSAFGQVNDPSTQRNSQPRSTSGASTPTYPSNTGRNKHSHMFGKGPINRMAAGNLTFGHSNMPGLNWKPQSNAAPFFSQPEIPESTMEGLDWETVFASHDLAELAAESKLSLVGGEDKDYMFTDDRQSLSDVFSQPMEVLVNKEITLSTTALESTFVDQHAAAFDVLGKNGNYMLINQDQATHASSSIAQAHAESDLSTDKGGALTLEEEREVAQLAADVRMQRRDPEGWKLELARRDQQVHNPVQTKQSASSHASQVTIDSNMQRKNLEQRKARNSLLVTPTTDYQFQDENPFTESFDSFQEGMEILHNDGNLCFAVLAFEAACQKAPDHFDAWKMLGSVQSENEHESAAIIALKEALRLDPTSLDILMKLAISYTNEGTISLAHEYLGQWLRNKYPEIPITEFGPTNYAPTFSQSLERMKEAFIKAAQLSLTTNKVDPDVQVGLGTLLFSAQNYELAADCFSSAIQTTVPGTTNIQSQLHLLWNRYGACLGNLGQHAAGIEAYEMALAICPNFVRARYNLGVVYYNKNEPLLGAQNTLQALKACEASENKARKDMLRIVKVGTSHGRLQEIAKRDEPTSMYATLQKCCGSLCRWDLVEAVGPNMDLRAFQAELDKV